MKPKWMSERTEETDIHFFTLCDGTVATQIWDGRMANAAELNSQLTKSFKGSSRRHQTESESIGCQNEPEKRAK